MQRNDVTRTKLRKTFKEVYVLVDDVFFVVTMLLGNTSYTVGKYVYLPFNFI